jgi:hypothetical protein
MVLPPMHSPTRHSGRRRVRRTHPHPVPPELTAADGRTVHYVSSGSVGKPEDGDPRAGWVELLIGPEAEVSDRAPQDHALAPASNTKAWIGAVVHRIDYDVAAVAEAMIEAGLPETLAQALHAS